MSLLYLTLQRLYAQATLTLATLTGLILAIAFITAVPLYADAVQFRVLEQKLNTPKNNGHPLPPFAYLYSYVGVWYGPQQWEAIQPLHTYLKNDASTQIGLPTKLFVQHVATNEYQLFPAGETNYTEVQGGLSKINLAFISQLETHIKLVEGRFPQPVAPNQPLEVLVAETLAIEVGLQVGEEYTAFNFRDREATVRTIPVKIVGLWQPQDPQEDFWFYNPAVFKDSFFVPEETFAQNLAPLLEDEVNLAVWYLLVNGQSVGVNDIDQLATRSSRVATQVGNLLPNTKNNLTPVDNLRLYRSATLTLTRLLASFSVPLVILLLAFIALVVGLGVNQRRNELAILRSRGATVWQLGGLALLEGIILGVVALVLGLGGGLLLTQLMGKVQTFLNFSGPANLRVALNETALWAAGGALILTLLAQIWPTLVAAQDTIITYKQEQARTVLPAWWQRLGVDFWLLMPTLYGYYQLPQQTAENTDPLQNPLVVLLPALTSLTFTLLFLRFFPWVLLALSWLLSWTNSVSLLLVMRHLARTPSQYATPLILLVLTVSLSVFTASLAQTMDWQLYDEALYKTGADLNLIGPGVVYGDLSRFGGVKSQATYLPLSVYNSWPGVVASSPVGTYGATAEIGSKRIRGSFMGIDPAGFDQVANWRWDFAPQGLSYLLNELRRTPDGVLVSRDFLQKTNLRPGEFFQLTVRQGENLYPIYVQLVGQFDYFPTWYPDPDNPEPLFVGNLDYLFAQIGGELSYNVWFQTQADFSPAAFDQTLADFEVQAWSWSEPYSGLAQAQTRPERQGIFGLLSVGFIASSLLTVAGFLLYTIFSFRRRLIELGILRAVGLSIPQLIGLIAGELGLLIASGLGLGVFLGVQMSQRLIPALPLTASGRVPPYLVEIAWPAVLQVTFLFVLMFTAALLFLSFWLRRLKIFQAVKLGETA